MEKINFVCGGRTGDLLHSLMVVKHICNKFNKKASLYITNSPNYGGDRFQFHINNTHNDLNPIIISQPYIDSFNILNEGEHVENFINLNLWRSSNLLFKLNWIDLLCSVYDISPPSTSWVECSTLPGLDDVVLIHRSTIRHTPTFPWEKIIKDNKCYFITNKDSLNEYELFPHKDKVGLITCNTFHEMFMSINSCKFFVGNMSTPLAIAHCLSKPHLGELFFPDEIHYIGDEKYIKDYYYISQQGPKNLNGIDKFLTI